MSSKNSAAKELPEFFADSFRTEQSKQCPFYPADPPIDWLRFGLPLLGVGANVWVIARAHACCSWWKSPRLSSSPSQWRLWPLTITPTVKLRRTTKLLLHLNGGFNGSIWGCCCWYYRILTLLLFNSLLSTLREDPWNSSLVLRGLVWSVCRVICRQLTPRVRVKLLFFVKGCIV